MFSHFFISRHLKVAQKSSDSQSRKDFSIRSIALFVLILGYCLISILSVSAATTNNYTVPPKSYIYVRTNPIIDDSWIGTFVRNIKKPTTDTTLTGTTQQDILIDKDSNWINNWKQSIQVFYTNESDIEFNSAPLLASMQNTFSNIFNTIFDRLTTDESNIETLSNNLKKTNLNVSNLDSELNVTQSELVALSGALARTNFNM